MITKSIDIMEEQYPDFNSLSFEERKKIAHYNNLAVIQALKQCLNGNFKNDITPNYRRKVNEWIKNLENNNE